MIGINFTDCDLNPKDPHIADKISGHKTGVVLLRIEEEIKGYGPERKHVLKTYYLLANVFKGASSLLAEVGGMFIWDIKGRITGFNHLGLYEEVQELTLNDAIEEGTKEKVIKKQ